MSKPTRAEMAEACKLDAFRSRDSYGESPHVLHLEAAAAQLKRDGELRDRLAKMAASWRHEQGGEPRKFCLVLHANEMVDGPAKYGCEAYRGPTCDACRAMDDAADELEAMLKENP